MNIAKKYNVFYQLMIKKLQPFYEIKRLQ